MALPGSPRWGGRVVVGVSRRTGMGEGGVEVHKGKGDYIELSRGRNFKTCLIKKNEYSDLNKTQLKIKSC